MQSTHERQSQRSGGYGYNNAGEHHRLGHRIHAAFALP
jgi:hypothetical protein